MPNVSAPGTSKVKASQGEIAMKWTIEYVSQ